MDQKFESLEKKIETNKNLMDNRLEAVKRVEL